MTTAADYLESCLKSLQKAEREMLSISTDPDLSQSQGWEECDGGQYSLSLADAGGAVQSAIEELVEAMRLIGLDRWQGINAGSERTPGL